MVPARLHPLAKLTLLTVAGVLLSATAPAAAASLADGGVTGEQRPLVRLNTEAGAITAVLYRDVAPHHVDQFLHFARTGFYAGTYFHRIVPGFVIQGGDPNSKDRDPRNDGTGGPQLPDVLTDAEMAKVREVNAMLEAKGYAGVREEINLKEEFSPTAKHVRGTLSMARSRHPDSAGSQFFICVDRTRNLDTQYTVFGQVIDGMDVVDAIVSAEQDPARGQNQPAEPVHVTSVEILAPDDLAPEQKAAWQQADPESAE